MTALGRLFTAMLISASALIPFSASTALAAPPEMHPVQCALPPGAYAIMDSSMELVGMLIIFPDCSVEIIPLREI